MRGIGSLEFKLRVSVMTWGTNPYGPVWMEAVNTRL